MSQLAIGLVFETFDTYTRREDDPPDFDVEYEPDRTVRALESAIERAGHRSVRLGAPHDLLHRLAAGRELPVDAVWNVAEGHGSRNREGWVPSLLEMAGVPALGSDALTLSLSLDKAWTHRQVAAAGVAVPPHACFAIGEVPEAAALPAGFPLFVKPRWEGTAKGIHAGSRVADAAALAREVARIGERYRQPALVEAFLPGAEYTVTVTGHAPPRVHPPLQRALEASSGIGLHALEGRDGEAGLDHELPGSLDRALEERLAADALAVFRALDCLDFARVDFKLDAAGSPVFLEVNPLPTFDPDGSFGILAELEGRAVAELLADVLRDALARLGLGSPVAPLASRSTLPR